MLVICAWCKRDIRRNAYDKSASDPDGCQVSHGICRECLETVVGDDTERALREGSVALALAGTIWEEWQDEGAGG